MASTNQLLAALIVQVCRLQTRRDSYPIDVLTGLGLSSREIGAAIGRSEAGVNVSKTRARKKVGTGNQGTQEHASSVPSEAP